MSWKTKGGLDKVKYLHTDYLTADYIILKNAALGEFDISGNLSVAGFAQFNSSLNVVGDVVLNKTLLVKGNTDLSGNVSIKANLVVQGNVITENNMTVVNMTVQDLNVNGNIYGNQYLLVDNNAPASYLYTVDGKYGLNNNAPQATLDIYGNISNVLNVFSSQASTTSVVSQNSGGKGVQVGATNTTSYVKFYNDHTIASGTADGLIQYSTGGNLVVDVANNTQILSSMAISQTAAVGAGFAKINGETLEVFGENNGGIYLNEVYGSTTAYTGSAISCVAKDNYSTTKLNIVDPSGVGLTICGGAFPDLSQNSMGAIGWTNTRSEFIPDIMMVGNGSLGHQRTTVGINSYSPDVSGYSLHINGPVKITNGEINCVANISIEAKALSNMLSFGDKIVCVGSPSSISSAPYIQNAYYSTNGGQSWNSARIYADLSGLELSAKNINTACYYSGTPSFSVIAGDGGYIFNTLDGITYHQINYGIGDNWTASYITSSHITLAYSGIIKYFSYSSGQIGSSFSPLFTNAPASDLSSAIYQMDASGDKLYVAGIGGIVVYDISSGYPATVSAHSSLGSYTIYGVGAYSTDGAVGVGNEVIAYTTNGGTSWTTVAVAGIVFTSVYVDSAGNAVAVGYTSASQQPVIYYTTTGFATWTRVQKDVIDTIFNISGTQKILFTAGSKNISIAGVNKNTMIIACVNQTYASGSQLGNTKLFYLYLPDLFNSANNKVMDIYGNISAYGTANVNNITVTGNANINTNLIVSNNVESTSSTTGTLQIIGGAGITGNTNIGGNLNVSGNIKSNYIDKLSGGNLYIGATSNGNINIGDINNLGGAGSGKKINIGFNGDSVYIGGSVYLVTEGAVTDIASSLHINANDEATSTTSGALVVDGGAGIGGNIYAGGNIVTVKTTPSTNTTTGALIIAGGAGIAGNINAGGIENSVSGNLSVSSTTETTSTASGALKVAGGLGVAKNAFIGGNTDICGNLIVRNHWNSTGMVLYDTTANTDNLSYAYNGNLVHTKGASASWYINQDGSASFVDVSMTSLTTGTLSVASGFSISNTTESTSVTTGAFTIPGGLGVAKNTYIGGNTDICGNLIVRNHWNSNGIVLYDTTSNTDNLKYAYNGNLVHTKGAGVSWYINQDGSASFVDVSMTTLTTGTLSVASGFSISNTTESTSTTTGAFTIPGGLGVAKNTYIGGNVDVSGNIIVRNHWNSNGIILYDTNANTDNLKYAYNGNLVHTKGASASWYINQDGSASFVDVSMTSLKTGTLSVSSGFSISATTESTSTTTGSFTVPGGLGVAKNTYIGGNLDVSGAMIVHNNWDTANPFLVYDTATNTSNLRLTSAGNLIYNNSGVKWSIDSYGNVNAGNAIITRGIFTDASLVTVSASGKIYANDTTASTSTSTGSVIVAGGVGVVGNINARALSVSASTSDPSIAISNSAGSTNNMRLLATTGSGAYNNSTQAGDAIINFYYGAADNGASALNICPWANNSSGVRFDMSSAKVNYTIDSTTTSSGGLVVAGGAGIGANVFVGKSLYVTNSYSSTNTTPTALFQTGTSANIAIFPSTSSTSPPNPILANNYQAVVAGNSAANGTSTLALTTGSTYNAGILIDASSVVMGAASNSTTGRPLNRIEINKTVDTIDISAATVNVKGTLYVNGSQINSSASAAPGAEHITSNNATLAVSQHTHFYDISSNTNSVTNINLPNISTNFESYKGLIITIYNSQTTQSTTLTGSSANIIGDGTIFNTFTLEPEGTVTLQYGYYYGSTGYWIVISKWNGGGNLNAIGLVATGGVASTSTTTGALIVTGGAGISGALYSGGQITGVSFNATSDYRIKEVEYDLAGSRDNIDLLRPIKYINKITGKEDFGFLAHEVQEIFPFLVDGEKDGDQNQTLNYIGLIGLLVNEVKTLKQEIAIIKRELGL